MNLGDCIRLDQQDALHHLREAFQLPPDVIYLDGNSLGPLPYAVIERIKQTVKIGRAHV